jgi:hypothetical protein
MQDENPRQWRNNSVSSRIITKTAAAGVTRRNSFSPQNPPSLP